MWHGWREGEWLVPASWDTTGFLPNFPVPSRWWEEAKLALASQEAADGRGVEPALAN